MRSKPLYNSDISPSGAPALRAEYHTLGCKLNFSETSTIGKMLRERGVERVSPGGRPDIVVVNTCSVTEIGRASCRERV